MAGLFDGTEVPGRFSPGQWILATSEKKQLAANRQMKSEMGGPPENPDGFGPDYDPGIGDFPPTNPGSVGGIPPPITGGGGIFPGDSGGSLFPGMGGN
jgi:hypothetical protein